MKFQLIQKSEEGRIHPIQRPLNEHEQLLIQSYLNGNRLDINEMNQLRELLSETMQLNAWILATSTENDSAVFTPVQRYERIHLREFPRHHTRFVVPGEIAVPYINFNEPLNLARAFPIKISTCKRPNLKVRNQKENKNHSSENHAIGWILRNALAEIGALSIPSQEEIRSKLVEFLANAWLAPGVRGENYVTWLHTRKDIQWLRSNLAATKDEWPSAIRPYGLILLIADKYAFNHGRATLSVRLNGRMHELAMHSGHLAVNRTVRTQGPFLGLMLVAASSLDRQNYQLITGYLHPVADASSLVLIDSNLEREVTDVLERFSNETQATGSSFRITRPIRSILQTDMAIPDFIIEKQNRVAALEVLGFDESNYLRKKMRQKAAMESAGFQVLHLAGFAKQRGIIAWNNELNKLTNWLISL